MEKYGVDTRTPTAEHKTAQPRGTCPKCGSAMTDGNPPICRSCGTRDQEPRKGQK